MVESAALLVDEVLPQQPMRQWVLSVPFPLRFLFASQPKIMGKALGIVYRTIAHRLARYLERQGLLVRDAEHSCLALESSDEDPMDQLRGHSMMCMDARMPRAQERRPTASLWDLSKGAKSLPCKRCPTSVMPTAPRRLETWPAYSGHPALRASLQLFKIASGDFVSLHAGVAAKADERDKLERLCRYVSRPAIAEKRLSLTIKGMVRYALKTPYRDGTTHVTAPAHPDPAAFVHPCTSSSNRWTLPLLRIHAPAALVRPCTSSPNWPPWYPNPEST